MLPEVEISDINHDVDHVHILISIPPKMRVSDVVRTFIVFLNKNRTCYSVL